MNPYIDELLERDVMEIDYEQKLHSPSPKFDIRVCVTRDNNGNPLPAYGVYNTVTGVRETEARALDLAQAWVRTVSKETSLEDALSELEEVEFTSDFSLDDEDDEGSVH